VVHLLLVRGCVGRPCAEEESCGASGCASIDVAGETLPEWTGEPPTFDRSDPCLAAEWDADGDGQGDSDCGGADCDDLESRAYEGATEDCDDVDNNCDTVVDEGCECTPIASVEDCTTSCGSAGRRTCGVDGWGACTAVELCNGSDDDCDARTDEGFTYVPTMETRLTTTTTRKDAPHVIWAGDRFAVAFEDNEEIFFAAFDEAAEIVTPAVAVRDDSRTPVLAWTGTSFGLVSYDPDTVSCGACCTNTNHHVDFLLLDVDGVPIGKSVPLANDSDANPMPRVVWDGAAFGVVYPDGDIYLHRVDEGGTPVRRVTVSNQSRPADLAWSGSSYAIAFADGDRVQFNEGNLTVFLGADVLLTTGRRASGVALTTTSLGSLVGWYEQDESVIGLATVAAGGMVVGTPDRRPSGSALRFGTDNRVALASGPGQALVAWESGRSWESELVFRRVAPDTTELEAMTVLAPEPAFSSTPSVAWGRASFGIAWIDGRHGSSGDVYVTTLRCE
jgi:hypothetical protein